MYEDDRSGYQALIVERLRDSFSRRREPSNSVFAIDAQTTAVLPRTPVFPGLQILPCRLAVRSRGWLWLPFAR